MMASFAYGLKWLDLILRLGSEDETATRSRMVHGFLKIPRSRCPSPHPFFGIRGESEVDIIVFRMRLYFTQRNLVSHS
jgi:hypothetical protein